MFITYTRNHIFHAQTKEIFNWIDTQSYEQPQRIENIKNALVNKYTSLEIHEDLVNFDEQIIVGVHASNYINYLMSLENIIPKWEELFWNDFWYWYAQKEPQAENAKRGYFLGDTYTAFTQNIWKTAKEWYQAVHTAWLHTLETGETWYALIRPPGHHAMKAKAHWYCYLANASIFANFLKNKGLKVWILDIDYHHGNWTQTIFYEDDQVVTVSIHTDPSYKFPYFSGYSEETGSWKGIGKNINIVLNEGTTDKEYIEKLLSAIEILDKENIDFLIVPLWFDTYEKDPIGWFKITYDWYKQIWKIIKDFNKKTLFIQEWWYNIEDIWKCAVSFFSTII